MKQLTFLNEFFTENKNLETTNGKDMCHAMRERRLCLWTASRSSPFRLDFEEAYFNISRSPEMLVPLSGGIALRYRSCASPGSKQVS